MKKLSALIMTLVLLLSPVTFAATTATPKIGIINVAKIMSESKQASKARDELKKKFSSRQAELAKLQDKVKAAQDKLNRDKAVMAKKELQKLSDQFENDRRELQRKQQAFMQDLQAEQNSLMRDLSEEINKIVKDVASKGKYDLIIQRDQVVFASESIDITDEVLKTLNK